MLNIATQLGKAAAQRRAVYQRQLRSEEFIAGAVAALNLLTSLQAQRDRMSFRSQDSADAMSAQECCASLAQSEPLERIFELAHFREYGYRI
jgi:hypothetical protein